MAACSTRRGLSSNHEIQRAIQLMHYRLQVAVAKIQQNLPELKRDGNTVLSSQSARLLYAQNSTNWATTVFTLMEFIPQLTQRLQNNPDEVIEELEKIRGYGKATAVNLSCSVSDFHTVTDPSGVRFSVTGNVLGVKAPRSTWGKYFNGKLKVQSIHDRPALNLTQPMCAGNTACSSAIDQCYIERTRQKPSQEGSYIQYATFDSIF